MVDDDGVYVSIPDLLTYGGYVGDLGITGPGEWQPLMLDVPALAYEAFSNADGGAGAGELTGGRQLLVQQTMAAEAFAQFLTEAFKGLLYIGSAATVVANSYRGTDEHNSSTVADVQYAFGVPGAPQPAGLPQFSTFAYETYSAQFAGENGQPLLALTAPDEAGTVVPHPPIEAGFTTVTREFSDGTRRVEVTSTTAGPMSAWGPTVTTTVATLYYGPGLVPIAPPEASSRTSTVLVQPGGQREERPILVTHQQGDRGARMEVLPDGRHQITVTSPDPENEGAFVERVTVTEAAAPDQSADDGPPLPLAEADERWDDGFPGVLPR